MQESNSVGRKQSPSHQLRTDAAAIVGDDNHQADKKLAESSSGPRIIMTAKGQQRATSFTNASAQDAPAQETTIEEILRQHPASRPSLNLYSKFVHPYCSRNGDNLFESSYQRNNKSTGHKNLRCFPHCCQGHKPRSYCGCAITIEVHCPAHNASTEELLVFARFEVDTESNYTLYADPQASVPIHIGDRVLKKSMLANVRDSAHPFHMWLLGVPTQNPSTTLSSSSSSSGEKIVQLEFNSNRMGYHYSWMSGPTEKLKEHRLRFYLFHSVSIPNVSEDVLECCGKLESTPFRISSCRRSNTDRNNTASSVSASTVGPLKRTNSDSSSLAKRRRLSSETSSVDDEPFITKVLHTSLVFLLTLKSIYNHVTSSPPQNKKNVETALSTIVARLIVPETVKKIQAIVEANLETSSGVTAVAVYASIDRILIQVATYLEQVISDTLQLLPNVRFASVYQMLECVSGSLMPTSSVIKRYEVPGYGMLLAHLTNSSSSVSSNTLSVFSNASTFTLDTSAISKQMWYSDICDNNELSYYSRLLLNACINLFGSSIRVRKDGMYGETRTVCIQSDVNSSFNASAYSSFVLDNSARVLEYLPFGIVASVSLGGYYLNEYRGRVNSGDDDDDPCGFELEIFCWPSEQNRSASRYRLTIKCSSSSQRSQLTNARRLVVNIMVERDETKRPNGLPYRNRMASLHERVSLPSSWMLLMSKTLYYDNHHNKSESTR